MKDLDGIKMHGATTKKKQFKFHFQKMLGTLLHRIFVCLKFHLSRLEACNTCIGVHIS